jgi:HSP20 family molecular chaperone IbpA
MSAIPPSGGGDSRSRMGARSPQEDAAYQAEREANRRINQAEKEIEDARNTAETRVGMIHDQYDKREADEEARRLELVEKQRLKGYEEIRELKFAQAAELNRVRREGERDLAKIDNFYRDSIHSTEHQGSEKLRELMNQQSKELEYEQKSRGSEVKLAGDTYKQQAQDVREGNEARLAELQTNTQNDYETIRVRSLTANEQALENFNRKMADRRVEQSEQLADLNSRASQELKSTRLDTSHKLAAYEQRQKDPFYKLVDMDARLTEREDEYVMTATIPEHEQKGVSVSVKGGNLVLSGTRKNEEKLEIEPGHTRGTNAFQSYLETFPIDWPVDANRMSRSFEGDTLVVRVPKKKSGLEYKSAALEGSNKPQRSKLERPKFPDNLPIAQIDAERKSSAEPTVTIRRKDPSKGSGTLT